MRTSFSRTPKVISGLFLAMICSLGVGPMPIAVAQTGSDVVLHPPELEKLMPTTVFFRGQTATVQSRNSGGVKFADGMIFFASLVDTSGYATGVQAKYQAYLVTEVPIQIESERLPAGAYGVGFIADHKFLVMDIGAHDLFTVTDERDDKLRRPTPLQVMTGAAQGEYRLYEGKEFVTVKRASN